MFITTEVLVFETPEDEQRVQAASHGHSHGPGGHNH